MKAAVVVPIRGRGEAWKVAEAGDSPALVRDREVALEIIGDDANGYHLVMGPVGCFTADTWHPSVEDAKRSAETIFGVRPDGWAEAPTRSVRR